MNRRQLTRGAVLAPFLIDGFAPLGVSAAFAAQTRGAVLGRRNRPGDVGWPAEADWKALGEAVGGRLLPVQSPFADCAHGVAANGACRETLPQLGNPFFVGDQPALTQTSGWLGGWDSKPSAYAVAATTSADVAAAVNFAREHNLRLVVRGGGHSYQGASQAPDSLMIWTRRMNEATVHEAFAAQDCAGVQPPQPAVSLGAGAMWIDAYDAVTTRAGRYVQGGGCATVGVAGLVQSGGFNMFSKRYGLAAAGLLEAEVVSADGAVRVVNPCRDPDLFWAIKGGGGGSFGVVTRVTLRTRELPETFGLVACSIRAPSDAAYKALIAKALAFYRDQLCNPRWGEKMTLRADNILNINMFSQGLERGQIEAVWAPFFDWVRANGYAFSAPLRILIIPARRLWDRDYMERRFPGALVADDRPGAPRHHVRFADDDGEVGWYIHGYQSAWLPALLLMDQRLDALADALFQATRHWSVQLFFSKGLAGAPQSEIDAARDTAVHPDALDAFALAIIADGGPPAFADMPEAKRELQGGRAAAEKVGSAMRELKKVAPGSGSYVAESDYFRSDWQPAFWGDNYRRLLAVKATYDPAGLFYVRHGVGSEAWSDGGFTRLDRRTRRPSSPPSKRS